MEVSKYLWKIWHLNFYVKLVILWEIRCKRILKAFHHDFISSSYKYTVRAEINILSSRLHCETVTKTSGNLNGKQCRP